MMPTIGKPHPRFRPLLKSQAVVRRFPGQRVPWPRLVGRRLGFGFAFFPYRHEGLLWEKGYTVRVSAGLARRPRDTIITPYVTAYSPAWVTVWVQDSETGFEFRWKNNKFNM